LVKERGRVGREGGREGGKGYHLRRAGLRVVVVESVRPSELEIELGVLLEGVGRP